MTKNNNKLLIVDDDEIFCEALSRAMQRKNFEPFIATNITDAIEVSLSNKPAYAIVDLRIAQESGLTLISKLLKDSPEIKIVILTGYASIATAIEAIKLGAIHYLTKPANSNQIIAAFEKESGDTTTPLTDQPMSVERLEWEHIHKVLSEHDGNISASARALNMHRRTLQRKLNKFPRKC